MIALAGGLGAAVCFAVSTLGSARSSRLIGAPTVVAWMMLVGLIVPHLERLELGADHRFVL